MKTPPSKTIYWIAAFKLFKAVVLVIVGLGALHLINRDVVETLTGWAHWIRVDPENRHLHRLFERLFDVSPRQLKEVAAGTFFYAVMVSIEGVGLFLRRRWAEYFTVIMTSLFLPLEVYELIERVTPARIFALILNAVIVWYLVNRLRAPQETM